MRAEEGDEVVPEEEPRELVLEGVVRITEEPEREEPRPVEVREEPLLLPP